MKNLANLVARVSARLEFDGLAAIPVLLLLGVALQP